MSPAHYFWIFYFFVIGAALGSFLNMLVYRVHHGLSLFGRSFCDTSKKPLAPLDLIPILSFVFSKGRCRDCNTKLSPMYPIVEILTGLLSVAVFIKIAPGLDLYNVVAVLPVWFLGFSLLFVLWNFAYYDFLYWEIDELSVRIGLGYVLFWNIVNFFVRNAGGTLPFFGDPLSHLAGGILLAGIIWITYLLSKGGGMGAGDIYLFGISGLLLGLQGGVLAFLLTSVIGSLFGLIKAAKAGKIKGLKIQFGPFIALGTILAFFFKDQIWQFFFLYSF